MSSPQFPQGPDFFLHHGNLAAQFNAPVSSLAFSNSLSRPSIVSAQTSPPAPSSPAPEAQNVDRPSSPQFPQGPDFSLHHGGIGAQSGPKFCGSLILDSPNGQSRPSVVSASAINLNKKKDHGADHQTQDSPLCALELICYRSSSQGCIKGTVLATEENRFNNQAEFFQACKEKKKEGFRVASDNKALFKEIRRVYEKEMCSFWRRWFSLTKVKSIVILKVFELCIHPN